jgi:hypothetical protein
LIPGGGPALITAEKAFDLVNDLKLDDPAGQMRGEIRWQETFRRYDAGPV